MRFLFNTTAYKPAYRQGGPVVSVSGLAESLVASGHHVTVLASNRDLDVTMDIDHSRDHVVDGVLVRYFPAMPTILQRTGIPAFARARVYTLGPAFERWLQANGRGYDVFDNQITFTGSNPVVSAFARRNGKVAFYHQRGNLDPKRLAFGKWKKTLYLVLTELPVMRKADVLIALTSYEVSTYRRLGLKNQIEVLPNGISECLLPQRDLRPSAAVADSLHSLGNGPCFLFMSRIHLSKGPEIFVDAFISCAGRCPGAVALMAGPDESNLVCGFLSKVGAAGLRSRFRYIGAVAGDDKLSVLKRADCLVLPTMSEGFSVSILEALASRCAVMTTTDACFPEIESIGAGAVVARRCDAFAARMTEWAEAGCTMLAEMGERGATLVREKFTWSSIASRYAALALRLASNPRH
jgi:glycosyltransferase involved in cell wall biosynthesis